MKIWLFLALTVLIGSRGIALAGAVVWPIDDQVVEICLPENASGSETFAAEEIQTYLRKMSGVTLPIRRGEPDAGKKAILIGRHPATEALREGLDDPDHYRIEARDDRIALVGGYRPPVTDARGRVVESDWGILYAAYQLLEDQGVRWLRPTERGEEVPKSRDLRLPAGRREFKPVFSLRWGAALFATSSLRSTTPEEDEAATLWAVRNRCNVLRGQADARLGGSLRIGGGGHVYSRLVPPSLFSEHPEFFPLIDGRRVPEGQLCLSNPELQEFFAQRVIENARRTPRLMMTSIDPNDGGGWCECEPCQAMDDPKVPSGRGGGLSMSSRVAAFNNIIARKVAKELPGLRLYCLAYSQYTEPPTRVDHLEKNLVIGLAPFAGAFSDYSRSLLDRESQPNRNFLESIKGFHQLGVTMYGREYLSYYAWPGPLPLLWVMQDRFRVYRDYGFIGVYNETHPCWGPQGISLYFSLKLLWNPDLDLKAAIADYCRAAYGPAARPMQRYHEKIEARGKGGPYFGSGGSHAIGLFTTEFLDTLKKDVAEARQLAVGHEPYQWRVETVLAGDEFARRYREVVTALEKGDPAKAKTALAGLEAFYAENTLHGDVFDKGDGHRKDRDGNPIPPGFIRNLRRDLAKVDKLEKDFRNPRLLQLFTRQWKFRIDPEQEGVANGWQQADATEEGWSTVDAGTPWQHQGFSEYQGTAWYRRRFPAPRVEASHRVKVIFDAIDGDATVWLNGKEIGRHELIDPVDGRNRWDEPFALDVTDDLNPDRSNVLVVRVRKENGNGGIHRGVRLVRVDKE